MDESLFDSIKHRNEYGQEYWSARELMPVLEYRQWRQFSDAIARAKTACAISGNDVQDHFAEVRKMIVAGKGAQRSIQDYHLSRYACYLIAMNGDPRKKAIALAQAYFAVKTRQQELAVTYGQLTEDQKRMAIRAELRRHNRSLADAASEAGVETPQDYAVFQNAGYKGLYGGLTAQGIARRKGLAKNEPILDHMGSTELAANLFRATQTDEKLRRDRVQGKEAANQTHYTVGRKVRQTIEELGSTMPEDLPTPEKASASWKRNRKSCRKRNDRAFSLPPSLG